MFVGRENELMALNKLYEEKCFHMVVLYGRRRIGKTTLISEFIKGKPAIFFTAQEANDKMNLERFSKSVYKYFDIPESTGMFANWNDAFDFLYTKAKECQFILAFDEFPYAASANRALKSILQTAIDHKLKNTGIFIVLCGSQVGFMENEVLGYKSPLFGRRTAQIMLEGLDYFDAGKLLGQFSNEDKIKLYSCIGGTPHYLAQVKPGESFEENIKRLYFEKTGYLLGEPMMLLQQELREPAMYNSIITTIAGGASRLNEIATKIGEDSPKVSKYLSTLINLQIIRKIFPFGENSQNSRKGIYLIADNCYSFWYRFVFPNKHEIDTGSGDLLAESEVFGERLSAYLGKPPFETICLQYLIRANRAKKLPFLCTGFGSWWGNDHVEKKQSDIDVIAANRATKQLIIGECKWKDGNVPENDIVKLLDKARLLSGFSETFHYLFTKTSQNANKVDDKISIVTVDMLFEL